MSSRYVDLPRAPMTWVRRLLLYPVLVLGGFHFLMTGFPVPLWHIEQLRSPVAVQSVTAGHLSLADGRIVRLPYIKEIPHNDPLFRAALADGVEVGPDGEAWGLMWQDRTCGMDPVVWRKVRVNLSDLAGALYPRGIDDSIVHPEAIAFFCEEGKWIDSSHTDRSHREGRLSGWDGIKLRRLREQFEFSAAQVTDGDG